MNKYSTYIQKEIKALANADKAIWLENYIKHDLKSLGVGIPQIREVIQNAEAQFQISRQPLTVQKEVLDELMQQTDTEYKIATILFLQLYCLEGEVVVILQLISGWFDKGYITDWNVCDWLGVRVLTPFVDHYPQHILPHLVEWNNNSNVWKARASLVAFAQSKTIEKHRNLVWDFSVALIERDERFCKTAVGWVLREYSKIDLEFVTQFLEKFKDFATREVINNALKYRKK